MRRLCFTLLACSALAVPAAALAATTTAGDGTLVVQNGQAPDSGPDRAPVVRLTITGSVIGQVSGQARIIIDQTAKSPLPEVTGADYSRDSALSDTAKIWYSNAGGGFKFRAVGGTYTIVVFGRVSLVAVGTGTAVLAGTPDLGKGDGRYSLNGDPWKSLPGTPTARLSIGSNG